MFATESCPQCHKPDNVRIINKGLKRFVRFLAANNRLACFECGITWRRRIPDRILDLVRKEGA